MVSGDVFRSPKDAMLLCVLLGSGVQIILSAFITLFFAALGARAAPPPVRWAPRRLWRGPQQCSEPMMSEAVASLGRVWVGVLSGFALFLLKALVANHGASLRGQPRCIISCSSFVQWMAGLSVPGRHQGCERFLGTSHTAVGAS